MMSSSRSEAGARSSSPCLTYTWQVEQAQTPPQAEPTWACAFCDASRMLVPTGIALITINTAANSIVQLATSPEMRGRVMGIYMLVFTGGTPLGAPLVGWMSELGGPRMGVVLSGALVLVGTALAVLATKLIVARVARRAPATA